VIGTGFTASKNLFGILTAPLVAAATPLVNAGKKFLDVQNKYVVEPTKMLAEPILDNVVAPLANIATEPLATLTKVPLAVNKEIYDKTLADFAHGKFVATVSEGLHNATTTFAEGFKKGQNLVDHK